MICQIDPQSKVPIYEQICRHVKFAIANASLIAGEHIPSVRELAMQAAVNVNTVARAYRDLQAEGILISIRGIGFVVAPDAPERCRAARLDLVRQRLTSILHEAIRAGISADEIRSLMDQEWATLALRE